MRAAPALTVSAVSSIAASALRGLQTNVEPWHVPERNDPIGSDWIILANAEVAVPLISDSIALLFFVDSGKIDTGGYRVGAEARSPDNDTAVVQACSNAV